MAEASDDQYGVLGLTVIQKHEVIGLKQVIASYRERSAQVRKLQLVVAALLLFLLVTGMLPFAAVIFSAAVVFFGMKFAEGKLLSGSVEEFKSIAERSGRAGKDILSLLSDNGSKNVEEIICSGSSVIDDLKVVNVDGEFLVLCEKVSA